MMRYTRYGWFEDSKAPYLSVSGTTKKPSYKIRLAEVPQHDRCCLPGDIDSLEEETPLSFASLLLLLTNIALGQRTTVQQGQNKFINRYNRTFFRENSPIRIELSQDSVNKLSSLSNYVHIRRWNEHMGVIEAIYEEYSFITGSLAYGLLMASRRYLKGKKEDRTEELKWKVSSKNHNLYTQNITEDVASVLAKKITPSAAAKIAEGAMLSGAIRDHSQITKDKTNIRLRSSLSRYDDILAKYWNEDRKSDVLISTELIDMLIALADATSPEFWIIRAGQDEITPSKTWLKNNERSKAKELR